MYNPNGNRAERRRYGKQQKKSEKVYHLTATQLTAQKQQIANEVMEKLSKMQDQRIADMGVEAFCLCMGLSIKILNEKYGFGTKRLGDFAEAVVDEYENGKIPLDELREMIYQKTKVKIMAVDNKDE